MQIKKWYHISGFLHDDEAYHLKRESYDKMVLEIGCFYGKSTVCMAEGAKKVVTVDTFTVSGNGAEQTKELNKEVYASFLDNCFGYPNILLRKGRSIDVVPPLTSEWFDLVFIDASHDRDSVLEDIRLCWPKLKDGGDMFFHDYGPKGWPGVTQALHDFRSINSRITLQKVATTLAKIRKEE
jgi:predicted O-methyltransferase YrrM